MVRSSLMSWGLPGQVAVLELAVSELVTNALVHGRGDIEVQLTESNGAIRLDVTDGGGDAAAPAPRAVRLDGSGGWGLRLVEALSDSWGAVTDPTRTRVWMVKHSSPGRAGPDGVSRRGRRGRGDHGK